MDTINLGYLRFKRMVATAICMKLHGYHTKISANTDGSYNIAVGYTADNLENALALLMKINSK